MTAVSMKAQRKMQKATVGHVIGTALKYAFLLLLAVIALVPFVWMIASSRPPSAYARASAHRVYRRLDAVPRLQQAR